MTATVESCVPQPGAFRVLVIGGYGFFGQRLVRRLARQGGLEILVGGRSSARAGALVDELGGEGLQGLVPLVLNARDASLADALRRLRPSVVVDASGPFQGLDHHVPRACIDAGVHYVDLADGREYVTGIGALHDAARASGVTVVSGASSVPALSGAAADHLAAGMSRVDSVDIGISPGNRTERGLSTVRAILGYCGRPLPAGGVGWAQTWRHRYPAPIGARLLSPCDVPDAVLLPPRLMGTPRLRFGAGLELTVLHRGMNLMAWAARTGLVRDWSRHAPTLKWMADLFKRLGSDAGAMHVTLDGRDEQGEHVVRTWTLVATDGDGPYVPTLAAAALVRRLAQGWRLPGARPCVGILSLDDLVRETDGLAIRTASSP